ncbi:MAG TPA: hypothetical protein PLB38_01010 [bacterium]|nr:hypothetical protein [bacterium]
MANTASVVISEERFNELCFLMLVRRQMSLGLSPMKPSDIHDWRTFVTVGRDTESVKMVGNAIWLTAIRFSKMPINFRPQMEIVSDLVYQMCRDYLLWQKRKEPLSIGEESKQEFIVLKMFLSENGISFSNGEMEAARVKFAQDWFDSQLSEFNTNLTPAR